MDRFPGDSDSLRTDRRACAIVHYQLKSFDWEFRLLTGRDVGCDCEIELSRDNKWTGKNIKIQIKGTRVFESLLLNSKDLISFPLEIKTINYALNSSNPFLLLVVDIDKENVYFLELHDYFEKKWELAERLKSDQKTINLHIPISNLFINSNEYFKELAFCTYVDGKKLAD